MSEELERRVGELEEEVADMKALLYGDPSQPEPGGLRALVNESVVVARRTEAQRNKDRTREQLFQNEVRQDLQKLKTKNVVSDVTVKSRWTLIREISTILLLIAAAVKILTEAGPKLAHLLGL